MSIAKRMSSLSPSLTLAISAKAKAMKQAGESVISFSVGEPDFNTPDYIIQAAKDALDSGKTKYTASSGLPELRKAICRKLKDDNGLDYEPSQIIVSNGAKHSIFNVLYALVDPGDEVIIPSPYWLTYPEVVRVVGGVPVFVQGNKENNYKMTAEQLTAAVTSRTKLLILNSPSNPTGAVYSETELRSIAAVCERFGIYVLSDEIYEKLIYGTARHFSIAAVSKRMKELTVVVNGVSKTYAMTGWRLGYLAAPFEIAKAIDSFQSHATSNACSITQYATLAALSADSEAVTAMRQAFNSRRDVMLKMIEDANMECMHPEGAFYVMLKVSDLYGKSHDGMLMQTSVDFANTLLVAKKVALVPGEAFGAPEFVRLSYALSMEDLKEGMARIAAFVSECR